MNRSESVTQCKSFRNPGSEKKMTFMGEILGGRGKELCLYAQS
jgi:hypothetical protein